MRVSTFFAATLPEGMAKVREALGPKAVVLSWRNARGGIEISASVQSEVPMPALMERLPPMRAPKQDAIADHFSVEDFQPKQAVTPLQQPTRGLGALVGRGQAAQANSMTLGPKAKNASQPPKQQPMSGAQHLKPTPQNPTAEPVAPTSKSPSRLQAFLMRAGLTPQQAKTFGQSDAPELQRALTACLSQKLKFDPVDAIPTKPILLVGPPGSGKSACAAKLAARTLSAGHEVLLISADSERCGGADQLRALAKRLGARFEVVTTLADLTNLVMAARQRGMTVFVDAPSACPAQPADMRATARMISETRLDPVLCLPADMRPDDMEDLARAYQAMGVGRAILTRFDLTSRRASALLVASQTSLAVAQFSATPYISGGVAMATPARLAAMLLEPFEDALAESAA